MAGRQPDFSVGALIRSAQRSESAFKNPKIGAAWKNENGSITLKIDAFVVLHGGPDLSITLFPKDDRPAGQQRQQGMPESDDEPVPF